MTTQASEVISSGELNSAIYCLNAAFLQPHTCTKSTYLGARSVHAFIFLAYNFETLCILILTDFRRLKIQLL